MELHWDIIHSQDAKVGSDAFWRAVDVWLMKPHVVNRRLAAGIEEHRIIFSSSSASLTHNPAETSGKSIAGVSIACDGASSISTIKAWQWLHLLAEGLKGIQFEDDSSPKTPLLHIKDCINHCVSVVDQRQRLKNLIKETHESSNLKDSLFEICEKSEPLTLQKNCITCIRKLIPKTASSTTIYEVAIFDVPNNEATFIMLVPKSTFNQGDKEGKISTQMIFPSYKFLFECNRITLSVSKDYSSANVSTESSSLSSSSSLLSTSIPSIAWLSKTLLPKLAKWACETGPSHNAPRAKPLVPMDRYTELYQEMKQKYGIKFVEIWPETTDPKKYVYEDVAIATYLLLLFEEERKEPGYHGDDRKQSFVDLGCGNGLLVHILNSEGHPGKGIDLRRRKIWDLYGPETCLEEGAVIASMETSFQDCDWLIGNHSDELTPWIPVMAARSSYKTRYFVLPCCFHDFDRKFGQRAAGESQYRTYLNFVRDVGEVCGFEVGEDRMRIPSTKRVCHVGKHRTYAEEEHPQILERIENYVSTRCQSPASGSKPKISPSISISDSNHSTQSLIITLEDDPPIDEMEDAERGGVASSDVNEAPVLGIDSSSVSDNASCANDVVGRDAIAKNFAPNFKPRDAEEKVKNCSRLERSLKDRITLDVAWAVLEDGGVRRLEDAEGGGGISDEEQEDWERSVKSAKLWRKGGSIPLGGIAKLFDSLTLKKLKSECGGLKTLLKSYNQVFEIAGNKVSLKDWSSTSLEDATEATKDGKTSRKAPHKQGKVGRDKQLLFKTKLCWFHAHHPDGCPRIPDACPFAHGQDELRSRPSFLKPLEQDFIIAPLIK